MSVLNGFKEFEKFVKISIITSIIGVFFTLGLVYFWQIKGALISAVSYQSVAFLVTVLMIIKSPWFAAKNFNARFSKLVLLKYLSYSVMTVVSAATIPVSQLFIRGYVIDHLSVTQAGWWEGMNRISAMYLMVVTSSFGVYYLPRLSEIKEKHELRKEIFVAFKVIVPALILGFLGIYIFRDLIIKILFTPDFYPMRNLFAWQLIGDLFKISSWLLAFLMVAKSMTRLYVITEIFFSILFVGLSILLVQNKQVVGVTFANTIVYIIYFITMLIIFRNLIFSKKRFKD
jgi:PST family polysaccharide transporter